jgi:hypothetical protein
MVDNIANYNRGRPLSDIDPGAIAGGRDWAYKQLTLGADVIVDGTAPPGTAGTLGTSAVCQYTAHQFACATADDYDHINVVVPNDYSPGGGMKLRVYWYSATNHDPTKHAHWITTWRNLTADSTTVLDAAGTAATHVDSAVPDTVNTMTYAEITCPVAVSGITKAGDVMHVTLSADSAETHASTSVYIVVLACLVYQRA